MWRVIVILFAVALLALILDSNGTLSNNIGFLRDPMAALTQRASGLSDILRRPQDLQTAYLQIQALQERVDTLERENEQLRTNQGEIQRLQELLNYQLQTPNLERTVANVIGRGPNPLARDLVIDIGSNDGVQVGMPVESARGLVGQIFRVAPDSSLVVLITSNASHVPSRLSQSRATGVTSGSGTSGLLVMDWIDLEAQLGINDVALTSGLTGSTFEEQIANRFPADIVIGRIVEVNRGTAELFQQAIIQPAVDFDALETVFVITNFEPVATSIFSEEAP